MDLYSPSDSDAFSWEVPVVGARGFASAKNPINEVKGPPTAGRRSGGSVDSHLRAAPQQAIAAPGSLWVSPVR
jgi:hypothetical protein